MLHPVGPLPVATYWLRRAVVFAGLLICCILLGVLLGAAGGSTSPAKPAGAGVDIPTPVLSASGPVAAAASPTTSAACSDADLGVAISTGAESYPAGSLPKFVVTVTNTGSAPCTRDLGAEATVITVLSGNDRIWSSGDCPRAGTDVRTLSPGAAVRLASSWDRKRSVPGCTTTGAAGTPAKTGVYVASVKLGTLSAPGTASFHLS